MDISAAEIAELMAFMTPAELRELESMIDLDPKRWTPQEGPQTQAYFSEADIILYGGAAGGGKDLDVTTPILTASGFKTMGELEVGDVVFDKDGGSCNVVAVSETFTDHECFAVWFRNCEDIIAGSGHQWVLEDGSVVTTKELHARAMSVPESIALVESRGRKLRVVDVTPAYTVPTRCIQVDSPSRTYLAGRGLVPTHNSDLLIGLAHQQHKISIIFRPSYTEMKGLVRRSQAILEGKGKWNLSDFVYRGNDGVVIEYGAMNNLAMAAKFQGQPHDFIGIDEGTNFSEETVRFVMGWLRSATDGGDTTQRCQVVIASNPPTSAKGDWVLEFFGPWLKKDHPRPAAPGELRWFVRHPTEERDIEVPGPEPYDFEGNRLTDREGRDVKPLSRTFIPAKLGDNKYLAKTGYLAQLQALPEPLRSKMLYGDFGAGREDDANQIIPVAWVQAAQERWKERTKPSTPQTAVGADIARGGRDKTILAPRWDNYFGELVAVPGSETKTGQAAAQLILKHAKPGAAINVDVIGIGSAAYDALTMNDIPEVYAMNGSEGSTERDRSGRLGFVNKRAEWWWRMREALDPENGEDICLPPDPELLADLCAPTWMLKARGIQVESKDEIKERIGRSPDRGDAAVYALADTQGGGYAVAVKRGMR